MSELCWVFFSIQKTKKLQALGLNNQSTKDEAQIIIPFIYLGYVES